MTAINKRANFDYIFEPDKYEAGLVLSGGEAKAIRTGHADISQAVVRAIGGELWLINATIPILGAQKYDSTRSRKLLMHRTEIVAILTKMKQFKLTIVPIKLYNRNRLVKLELGLGKSKRKFEKKEAIKKKDVEREIAKELRGKDY